MIDSKKQYNEMLDWVDEQFDLKVTPDSIQGQRVSAVLMQLKEYEDIHFPIPAQSFDGK